MVYSVLLLPLAGGCASMRPQLKDVTARVTGIDFSGVNLAVDLAIKNNALIGIHAPRGRYALQIAGHDLLRSEDVPAASLPALGVGTVTLPARIDYRSLWSLAQSSKDAAEAPYHVEGALIWDVAGQSFPLDFAHDGMLPVLRMPNIVVTGVDTSGVSLSGTDVAISADITNPNVFALGTSGLGYRLKLGGIDVGGVEVSTADKVAPGATGSLTAKCRLAAASAATAVLKGGRVGAASLIPSGAIDTPFGSVKMPGQ